MRLDFIRTRFRQSVGSTRDPELTELILDSVMEAIPSLLAEVREEVREEVAARLDTLGDGRLEYVFSEHRSPQHAGDIEAMGGTQGMIYGEATGAKWLARIIRGDSDKGWLPSWRWS